VCSITAAASSHDFRNRWMVPPSPFAFSSAKRIFVMSLENIVSSPFANP
jgi:hypothetical protein